MTRKLQCKHIPDAPILAFLASLGRTANCFGDRSHDSVTHARRDAGKAGIGEDEEPHSQRFSKRLRVRLPGRFRADPGRARRGGRRAGRVRRPTYSFEVTTMAMVNARASVPEAGDAVVSVEFSRDRAVVWLTFASGKTLSAHVARERVRAEAAAYDAPAEEET